MKKKIAWLVVTGGMVAALLLASCAPAAVKEEAEKVATPQEKDKVVVPKEVVLPKEEANLVKWTGMKRDGTVVEKMIEKPRYGGIHIAATLSQPLTFDDATDVAASAWANDPTNEELISRDWTRGPAGTGEWSTLYSIWPVLARENGIGVLAESWELPDPETVIFHIRKGVHWQDKPPLNGREFTADDAVFSLRIEWGKAWHKTSSPWLADMKNVDKSIYVSPTDKWAVVFKTLPSYNWMIWEKNDVTHIVPRDVIEKYGNMYDWKNVVGTGPFILKDYVGASSLTYVRNPSYWQKDPFFPENQLPYLDTVKILIIPDASTRIAGLRAGQIDTIYDVAAEDAESLMKTNPDLRWEKYLPSILTIYPRNDLKPFDDIRVRRALSMAINKRELTDVYYGGKAELFAWPVPPIADFIDLYIPLEEMPESVKELYTYNPEKARQLLTEAGYPQGFKAEILTTATNVDLLSVIKEYWAKIGVDLKLDIQDTPVASARQRNRAYTIYMSSNLVYSTQQGMAGHLVVYEQAGSLPNSSMINDPWTEKKIKEIAEAYSLDPKQGRTLNNKENQIYRLERHSFIPLPTPYDYVFYQPWLKNFYGRYSSWGNQYGYVYYAWIDQDLKKAMGR